MSAALPALGADPVLRLDRINSFYGPVQVHVDLTVDVEQEKTKVRIDCE